MIAAPGRHGPTGDRRPAPGKTIRLSAGLHKFEYYHAAAGASAMMLAAWVAHPVSPKSIRRPFRRRGICDLLVAHLPAGRVSTRTARLVPDFLVKIAGEVPLPDNPLPMLGVAFRDASPRGLSMQGKPLGTSATARPARLPTRTTSTCGPGCTQSSCR